MSEHTTLICDGCINTDIYDVDHLDYMEHHGNIHPCQFCLRSQPYADHYDPTAQAQALSNKEAGR